MPETTPVTPCVSGTPRDLSDVQSAERPLVGVIMGSTSDWPVMAEAARVLAGASIPHECRVVSAHRTPGLLYSFASEAAGRGLRCIIAGAGGAAHLPGMTAALTPLPVLGVPVESRALQGLDSLLSILQMPYGIAVATFPIGPSGAAAAARFAIRILQTPSSCMEYNTAA